MKHRPHPQRLFLPEYGVVAECDDRMENNEED